MGTVKNLLYIARKEIGSTESPAGSNKTKYGKWFGLDGNPWCMMFIMWCFAQAGVKLPKRTASCGDLMRAVQAAGASSDRAGSWVTANFQPGDVVIYDFSGKRKTTQHCGIVEMELPGYGVQAIEGNTSERGSQDNGGMVCRKNRAQKYIIGAVRPTFDTEKEEDIMTGKEIYDALQDYLRTQKVPAGSQAEYQEAVKLGITDGTNPCQMVPRWQAAIMAMRAKEKNV